MIATRCPSRDRLAEYLLGTLPESALEDVTGHVEQCDRCQQQADTLEAIPDSLVQRLRGPLPRHPLEEDDQLPELLESAKGICGATSEAAILPLRLRDYRLLEKLGEGGMGSVYRARHERLGRDVALKLLSPSQVGNRRAESRFEREMKAIGTLQHNHIVSAIDAGIADGTYYLVMELIDGCDGSQLVGRLGPLPIADACEVVRQAALGLQHAHEHGLIHRDVKPSNLLIDRSGNVKVGDLGLAQIALGPGDDERTPASQMLGTLDYMAPEQAEGGSVNARTDLYAIGGTLFKLLTGAAPFASGPGDSPLKKILAHRDQTPPSLSSLRPDVPKQLEELTSRLLAKDPAQRPGSSIELARALEAFCAGADLPRTVARALSSNSSTSMDGNQASVDHAAARRPRPWWRLGLVASAAAVVLVGLVIGWVAALQNPSGSDGGGQVAVAGEEKSEGSEQTKTTAAEAQSATDRQKHWAKKLNVPIEQENSIGMKLTLIPPGEFLMGSTAPEVARAVAIEQQELPDGWPVHYFIRKVQVEGPQHRVRHTRPCLMGTCEVTVGQWDRFVSDSGYKRFALSEPERYGKEGFGRDRRKPDDAQTPMTFVTWDDANALCNWLSTKENRTYRLPTEAEWEYACRAGTTTRWFTGNEPDSLRDFAWTLQTNGKARDPKTQNAADPQLRPVGTKKPNAFGLHDTIGNVWEWCRDHFRQDYYQYAPREDPPGPKMLVSGPFSQTRVLRGGGAGFRENECRSATRWFLRPKSPRHYIGFRVVVELKE